MKKLPDILAKYHRHVLGSYAPIPVVFTEGKGAELRDIAGKRYIDLMSGLAVNVLGHGHPAVVKAIQKQSQKLLHTSNLYVVAGQAELAAKLTKAAGLSRAFFCNSGTESNEAAIKLTRHASIEISGREDRIEILAASNSFHGRTLGSLSATMQKAYQTGVGPLVPGFREIPFNDVEALANNITDATCAVMLEPIQAEGGMHFPDPDYLVKVRRICDDKKIFLILDEVQTGMARTGKLFAFQHFKIKPDVLTLAKGMGGGVPVGAALFSEEIAKTVRPGLHASTFGGNPLAMAVSQVVLDQVSRPDFLKSVRSKGSLIKKYLQKIAKRHTTQIATVEQLGLFAALKFKDKIPGAELTKICLEKGIVINVIKDQVMRVAPPLVISDQQMHKAMGILSEVLRDHFSKSESGVRQ